MTTNVSAENKYLLDRMNSTAFKAALGTILEAMDTSLDSLLAGKKVIAAGLFTTAGGDAAEAITTTGAVANDVAIVTLNTAGSTPRTISSAKCGTNKIDVTLSGDPSTDHILNYIVVRP